MADVVHKMMEEMVPELEELQRAKLFSEAEIKAIVKKRTNYEYQVQRKGAEKHDFFRYLQYEMNLDLLRKARKKRLGIRKLPELSEFSGVRRIHYIFNRMLHRYGHDMRLWVQYIDFSMKSKSFKSLNKTFARALQLHPANEGLWIMTASWEFNHNQNMQAARALMSRAVRLNKRHPRLWHEFFRLELFYVMKIRERMSLFGMENSALVPKQGTRSVETADLPTSLSAVENNAATSQQEDDEEKDKDFVGRAEGDPANMDGSTKTHFSSIYIRGKDKEKEKEKEDKNQNPFLEGAIPLLIFQSAAKEMPKDFGVREGFLEIVKDFEGMEKVKDAIYQSIVEDFSEREECWNCLARRKLSELLVKLETRKKKKAQERMVLDKMKQNEMDRMDVEEEAAFEDEEREAVSYAIEVFEEAVQKLSTAQMWKDYITFCEQRLQDQSLATPKERLTLAKKILSICSRAVDAGVTDEEIFESWIDMLLNLGDVRKAMTVSKTATTTIPASSSLWLQRITLVVRQKALKSGGHQPKTKKNRKGGDEDDEEQDGLDQEVNSLIAVALDSVPAESSLGLRSLLLELCMASHVSFDIILTHFKRALAVLPRDAGLERLKEGVVTYVATSQGIEHARQIYECAFDYPPTPLAFFHKCIAMEKTFSAQLDYERVRALYHRALSEYGETATETWLDLVKLEADRKDFKAMQTIYWQAKNRLTDPSTFIEKYNLIK